VGRIEDALAKLQAREKIRDAAIGTTTLGRVIAPADRLPEPAAVRQRHNYGGKRVEIDLKELHAQGLLAPDSQERKLADQYRVIKRPLLRNAANSQPSGVPRGNLLMIASALAGEGKTFTCLNLCLSMAREEDWDVVLVDGDCKKPHLTRLFGAEAEFGFMDLLRDTSAQFDSFVMPTSVPGLSLLPAGKRDERASELIASARMDALCAELAANDTRRIVLFDSAPLLLTTESAVLASHVGQVVMVVQANRTPQKAVLAAIDKLDPAKAINLVLNQVDLKSGSPYGEYYGYDQPA
jgi:exopolysaccharide/PEP-CTERM locus tyrosine autokinase